MPGGWLLYACFGAYGKSGMTTILSKRNFQSKIEIIFSLISYGLV